MLSIAKYTVFSYNIINKLFNNKLGHFLLQKTDFNKLHILYKRKNQ